MNTGTLFLTICALWLGSEIALGRIRRSRPTDARRDRSSLRILWTTIAISVTAGVLLGTSREGHWRAGAAALRTAGPALIVLGLTIRWIAILSLRQHFTVDVSILENHRLHRKGIYRYVRHPAYAGSLLSFLGLGLSFSNIYTLMVIFIPVCAAFLYRISVEEDALTLALGEEYRRYASGSWRLLPGVF